MTPLAIILVVTVLLPGGGISVHSRPIGPYGPLSAYEVCQRAAAAYLTAPPGVTDDARDMKHEAERRGAACVAIEPGGRDL